MTEEERLDLTLERWRRPYPLELVVVEEGPRRRWGWRVVVPPPRSWRLVEEGVGACDECEGWGCGRCSYSGNQTWRLYECSWCRDVVEAAARCMCDDIEDWPGDGREPDWDAVCYRPPGHPWRLA